MTPCAHSDHPLDLALAAVARYPSGNSVSAATGSVGIAPPLVWGSLDMRSTLPTPLPRLCPSEGDGIEHGQGLEEHGGLESGAGQGEAQVAGAARGAGSAGVQVELLNATDRQSMQRLERLISSRPKDALQLLRKWLKEGLRAERLTASVRSRAGVVPVSELQALIGDLSGTAAPGAMGAVADAGAAETEAGAAAGAAAGAGAGEGEGRRLLRHRGLLSLAAAVAEASAGPLAPRWEAAGGLKGREGVQAGRGFAWGRGAGGESVLGAPSQYSDLLSQLGAIRTQSICFKKKHVRAGGTWREGQQPPAWSTHRHF